jgi:alpha-aminoadipate/glutamate carrier protein LysW
MVTCPECDIQIDVDEEELDEGDLITCDECGAELRVLGLNPLELESAEDAEEEVDAVDLEEGDDEEHWP